MLITVAALNFLDKHASEDLTTSQARSFTEMISPDRYPSVCDAIRFCYYMRSIGFDTYAKVDPQKSLIKLFVADPSMAHGDADKKYWVRPK